MIDKTLTEESLDDFNIIIEEPEMEIDVDVSDMVDTDDMEIDDDSFDDELVKLLNNEIKLKEFNRRGFSFKIKNDKSKFYGVPMAKMLNNAFLFKTLDGKMKKLYLKDIILENEKPQKSKLKICDELSESDEDPTNIYTLIDGRKIELIQELDSLNPIYFQDFETKETLYFKDIKHQLEIEDNDEIETLIDEISQTNETSSNWQE